MESKTDNELIAEFTGRPYGKNADRNGYLKYDSSWDHLMPVVEKINQAKPKHDFFAHLGLKNITIDSLYKAVVEFIKWHNEQTKQA